MLLLVKEYGFSDDIFWCTTRTSDYEHVCIIKAYELHVNLRWVKSWFLMWNIKTFLFIIENSNTASFFRFVDKGAIYRWYNLIRICAGECDELFHWQHKLCATYSANVNINYRLPIKVYYTFCTLRNIIIEINHGSQNVFFEF